jgi:acetyltransferase-like isoleucine patch superfamily enzyme
MKRSIIRFLLFPWRVYKKIIDFFRRQHYLSNGATIGKSTFISPMAYIDVHRPGKVTIGENCYITRNVVILCHTDTRRGGPLGIWEAQGGKRVYGDVTIGNNVFIGVNSVILPGVTIGDNAIIGALSLVNTDVPAGKIAAGVPIKILGNTVDHVRDAG